MSDHKTVYWDTTIWIALLRDENRPGNDMEGVLESLRLIEARKQHLLVSMSIRLEMRAAKMGEEAIAKFVQVIDSSRGVTLVGEDLGMVDIRDEILHYYNTTNQVGDKLMGDYDAQHLAYSILHRVDAFYTFDRGKKKDKKTGKRGINLLSLDGMVAGKYKLTICKPPPPLQTELKFDQ